MMGEITTRCTELDISFEIVAAIEESSIIVDFAGKWTGEFEIIRFLGGLSEGKHIIICMASEQ